MPPQEPPKEARIVYQLTSDDGFYAQSDSFASVWQQLLDAVESARLLHKMEPLYSSWIGSSGLDHPVVRDLLEQLPNAELCRDYSFQFRLPKEGLKAGPACIRVCPFDGRKKYYDMFSWLASSYRLRPQLSPSGFINDVDPSGAGRHVTNFDLVPMALRFKQLRRTAKRSVGVFKSDIHGRGLFSTRDFDVIYSFLFFVIDINN